MINNNEDDDEGEEVNAPVPLRQGSALPQPPIQSTPTLTLAPIQGSDTPTQLPIRSQSALDPSGECLRSVFLSFCSFQWSCYIIFTGASTNKGAGPIQQSMDLGNISYLIVKWYVKKLTFAFLFSLAQMMRHQGWKRFWQSKMIPELIQGLWMLKCHPVTISMVNNSCIC